jgi:uncharacterized coiled-coil protein SlyX
MTRDDDMANARGGDPTLFTIRREIPAWGILGVLGAAVIQAGLMWASQREQGLSLNLLNTTVQKQSDALQKQSEAIQRLTEKLSDQSTAAIQRDAGQDYELKDLSRRVGVIEAATALSNGLTNRRR